MRRYFSLTLTLRNNNTLQAFHRCNGYACIETTVGNSNVTMLNLVLQFLTKRFRMEYALSVRERGCSQAVMLPKEIINGIPILRPNGRFDSYKVGAIDASMEVIFAEMATPQIIVNLMQVNFIDAAAIDALQAWREKAQQQKGDVVLSSLRQTVRMRLNIQTLAQFMTYEDDEQALAALTGASDDES